LRSMLEWFVADKASLYYIMYTI